MGDHWTKEGIPEASDPAQKNSLGEVTARRHHSEQPSLDKYLHCPMDHNYNSGVAVKPSPGDHPVLDGFNDTTCCTYITIQPSTIAASIHPVRANMLDNISWWSS